MTDTFEVVFVCTGNRFRSPIAAATFEAVSAGVPVRVHSLGTLDLNAAPALAEALRLCSSYGLDLSAHRSRCLDGVRLDGADLIVGFEPKHVARAVVEADARRERSFLLGELVEGLEAVTIPDEPDPVSRARFAVALVNERRQRGEAGEPPPPIADPYGGTQHDYEQAATRVHDLTGRVATALLGTAPGR